MNAKGSTAVAENVPVTGGQYCRFTARRRTENVAVPRRSVLARVLWRNDAGTKSLGVRAW